MSVRSRSRWLVTFGVLVVAGVGLMLGSASLAAPADLSSSQSRNGAFAVVAGDVYGYSAVLDAYEKSQPAGLPAGAVVGLESGKSSSCALTSDGLVFCWGRPRFGQLGPGAYVNDDTAVQVTGVPPAVDIALGYHHGCLVSQGGTVWCWGLNQDGQLGIEPTDPRPQPVRVENLPGPVRTVEAGLSTTCAVTRAHDVYCWGANRVGQLGTGGQSPWELPSRVHHLPHGTRSVAVGGAHTCALSTTGVVRCWGNGMLVTGRDEPAIRPTPTRVAHLDGRVRSIAADWSHACALCRDGLHCWGDDQMGQLGGGRGNPAFVQRVKGGPERIASFALGWSQTCATSPDGRLWCWGSESSPDGRSYVPERVSGFFPGYMAQPDALLRNSSGWTGRDLYSRTGRDQTVHRKLGTTLVRRVRIRIVNDGDARDVIRLDAERTAPGVRLDAKVDGANRRRSLLSGELRWNLAPGEARDLVLTYSPSAAAVSGFRERQRILARSGNDGMFIDVVRVAIVFP